MKQKKFLSLFLSLILLFGMMPVSASAEAAPDATVYVTVSNQGVLAQAEDESIVLNRAVTVPDENQDGILSVDEALKAAHKTYLSEDAYITDRTDYGLSVYKLWGVSTFNTLFFVNDAALSVGVDSAVVTDGDRLTASINQDNTYFADWYTFFDAREKTVAVGEEFMLTLQGFCGMAYPPEDAVPVAGLSVGTWENGRFRTLENLTTDENGSVTLSFTEAGTYYITASGTVCDEVMDYSSFQYVTANCPIIAPGCTITVTKELSEDDAPEQEEDVLPQLTDLILESASSGNGAKNEIDIDEVDKEEMLSPTFSKTHTSYAYTVNYFRDLLTLTPTANGAITINAQQVESGEGMQIPLQVGENVIDISVAKDEKTTQYQLHVYRKEELRITGFSVLDGTVTELPEIDGGRWSCAANFSADAETVSLSVRTNITEAVTVILSWQGNTYIGAPQEVLTIPVGMQNIVNATITLIKASDEGTIAQSYVLHLSRPLQNTPDSVCSYLPAPGQFVNLDAYQKPEKTLSASGLVTLGAFGGNVVYQYDAPIENSPNNPYGIDFIVMGNCFTNEDESTSSAAAEPASVMVSADGESWYELAGSEYYEAFTRRNVTLTYTNSNTVFSAASDIPWADSDGESGILPKNDFHTQAYYPNPAHYNAYQTGVGKNSTYTTETVSFAGTMIEPGFYPFGYADSHTEVAAMKNKAANPYVENHEIDYNGDGFDLAWAVDQDGTPVSLEAINYIKIYNPVLSYSGSSGEKSPEIKTVLRAFSAQNPVGVSAGLSRLSVNGEEFEISDGLYTYDIDANGASSFVITPTAVNADANIYVSNQRVASGDSTTPITAVEKLRIIVQEGEKEPIIYHLNLSNIETAENNADLSMLTLTPGDVIQTPDAENKLRFTVANSVSAIRLMPACANKRVKITLNGGKLKREIALTNQTASDSLALNVGENTFMLHVESENGASTKIYTVVVTRQKKSSDNSGGSNTISVKFSLTGDKIHYNSQTDKLTAKHTNPVWIASKTVTIPKGQTVKYLTEMVLNNEGLDYTTDGIYISAINGIAEFDNGPNAGWMFRINGTVSEIGYQDCTLSDGDVVKWFYTDDYTKEKDYEGGWDDVNSSSSASSSSGGSSSPARTNIATSVIPIAPNVTETTFTDTQNHWASDAIKYVYQKSIMQGVSGTEFSPDTPTTRAMLLTVLYRLENPGAVFYENPFADVPDGAWYTDAVCWAFANNVTSGMSETQFAPEEAITREQLAVIIYRYAAMKGLDVETRSELSAFSDEHQISTWALEALRWANATGLVSGTSETTLSPKDTATRAQVACILMRFCENVAK